MDFGRTRLRDETASAKERSKVLADRANHEANRRLDRHPVLSSFVVLTRVVIKRQSQDRASLAAAGTAFWLVIAFPPALIAVVSIFGLVISPETVVTLLSHLTTTSALSEENLRAQLTEYAQHDTNSLSISLIVSLSITLWSVAAGVYSLSRAVRLAYGLAPQNYVAARARSFVVAVIGVLALGLLAVGATVIDIVNNYLTGWTQGVATVFVELPLGLLLLVATTATSYRIALARKTGVRQLLPGAFLSAVAILLLVIGFQFYLKHWADYTAVYGAAAGAIILMLLAYMSMYIVVLGAIINDVLLEVPESRPWPWITKPPAPLS